MESVCIVWVKGSNEMVFQELDYSHFVDNGGLREVNEVAWEWIPESNYKIKVEVATCCPTKLLVNISFSLIHSLALVHESTNWTWLIKN